MPNPFPGVNPYIEAAGLWPGFHNLLIGDMSRLLNRVLKPRGYAAFVEERLELVDLPNEGEDRRPDIIVTRTPSTERPTSASRMSGASVVELEPAIVQSPSYETIAIAYIEIRHLPQQRLITTIELLSPSNKQTGRREYTAKRQHLLASDVNLLEIDLLLEGQRPSLIGQVPEGHFFALVSRFARKPECEVYGWSIRRPLPHLPVPLKPDDSDAALDLALAYATTFDDGPYDVASLYDRPLPEALSDADRRWIADRIDAQAHS